jgi:GPI mannosyltransferase 3
MMPSAERLLVRLFAISFIVHILSAWFNVGFHQLDEHFQIIEFASYKLGITPANVLPWEFAAQIRPAMQPGIAYIVLAIMDRFGVFNPFHAAFVLRLMSAFLGWMTALVVALYALPHLKSERAQRLIIWLSALFWCAPYLHTRFSSESWSGTALFLGVVVVLQSIESVSDNRWTYWLLLAAGGVLMGFSFEMRFQSAIAVAGFIAWMSLYKRRWRESVIVLAGVGSILSVGAVVDAWLYGVWVFPPWTYAAVNLLQGTAATFGVEPWWWYFSTFAVWLAFPPFGIVVLAGLALACVWHWRSPFVWVFVPFVLVHSLIGHKEDRFLFPMIFAVPVLLSLAAEFLLSPEVPHWLNGLQTFLQKRWLTWLFIATNCLLLTLMTFKPASLHPIIYEYCYDRAAQNVAQRSQPVVLYTLETSPFSFKSPFAALGVETDSSRMETRFYQPQNLRVLRVTEAKFRSELASVRPSDKPLLFFHRKIPPPVISDTTIAKTVAVTSLPAWILAFNVNNWVSRTNVWTIWECKLRQ